jgi:FMN phosphatase YigB (HAD superfamily)
MKPKAVVFDLGKVLLHFDWMRAAQKLAERSKVPAQEMLKTLDYTHTVIQYELGAISSREFFAHAREAIGFTGTFEEFAPAFADIFSEIPAIIGLQAALRQRGIPTFIFSNTNELAANHVRANYPFFAHFTGYVFSFEHGSMKPDAKLYEVVERLSACRGPELLYIDDLPKNIEAGSARGWQVILQENPEKTVAAARATGLLD